MKLRDIIESNIPRKEITKIMKDGYDYKTAKIIVNSNKKNSKIKIIPRKDILKYANGISDKEVRDKMKRFYDKGEKYIYYDTKTKELTPGSWDE